MTPSEILQALAERDPFIRANGHRWTPVDGVLSDRAGVIQMDQGTLVGTGDIPELARLLADAEFSGIPHALMPLGTLEYAGGLVAEKFGLVGAGAWTWLYMRELPPETSGEEYVGPLDDRLDEVAEALSEANPETHAARNLPEHHWWGYVRGGKILGVCAVDDYGVEPGSDAARRHGVNLSGLGTRPDARGQGVGSAMMAAITRHFVQRYGIVHYGVWNDNAVAFRIYRRLGYTSGPQIQSFTPQQA